MERYEDILAPDEQEKLELQLNETFNTIVAVSKDMKETKKRGNTAKKKRRKYRLVFGQAKLKLLNILRMQPS